MNYNKCFITFYLDREVITLQGETLNHPTQAQFHQLRRLQATDVIAELYTLQLQTPETPAQHLLELPSDMEPEISILLHTYKEVFSIPHALPPNRSHDHSITLLPNAPPIKVRPYRYPHSQKSEIEKIVADMLQEGIIQPRSSPFSSPVLLLKKKDGT